MSAAVRNNLLDLIITFCVPLMILSPNLFGSGISMAAHLGGGQTGNIRVYLLSALLPVAYKTSIPLSLQGLVFLGSAMFGGGVLKSLLQGAFSSSSVLHRQAQEEAMDHPGVARALVLGSVMFGLTKLLFGGVNMLVTSRSVSAAFGTEAFNAQVVFTALVMYFPGLLIGSIAAVPAMVLIERTVKGIYGQDVSLSCPEQLVQRLELAT